MAIKVSSNLDTKNAADKYATHLGNLTKGGLHTKDSIAQMNSIPVERRSRMMLCVVGDIGNGSPALYWLNTPPNPTLSQLADNQYWQLVPLGSTVEGVLSLQGFQEASALTILDTVGNSGDTFIVESGGNVNNPLIFGGQAVTLTVGDYLVYDNNRWNLIPTGASSVNWNTLAGKPTTFPPTAHQHVVADITDFPDLSGYLTSSNVVSEILESTQSTLLADIGAIKNYIASELADTIAEGISSVKEYANLASFPATGVTDIIYIAADTDSTYRWDGATYVQIGGGSGGGIGETYATIAALLADQGNQVDKTIYEVTDASTDATVSSGYAYYKYLGIANGVLTDYTKVSESEAFSENSSTVPFLQTFTYTTGAQEFTLTETPEFISYVTRNGKVFTDPNLDYSTTTNVLTIIETLENGDEISIQYFTNVGSIASSTQEGVNRNGSTIRLDKVSGATYNESTPLTGNIIVDLSDSVIGGIAVTEHNDTVAPTLTITPSDLPRNITGSYITDVLNEIWILKKATKININYVQPTVIAPDVTSPTLTSATIENGTDNILDFVFNEAVTITTAGWSIATDGAALSILNVASGSGTTTPKFTLSRSILDTETLTISYDSATGNTVDAAGNELADIVNSGITNNVTGVAFTPADISPAAEIYDPILRTFDGTDATDIDLGVLATVNVNNFEVYLWVSPTDGQPVSSEVVLGVVEGASNRMTISIVTDGKVRFSARGKLYETDSPVYVDGGSQPKYLNLRSISGIPSLYVDGLLVPSTEISSSLPATNVTIPTHYGANNTGTISNFYNGQAQHLWIRAINLSGADRTNMDNFYNSL